METCRGSLAVPFNPKTPNPKHSERGRDMLCMSQGTASEDTCRALYCEHIHTPKQCLRCLVFYVVDSPDGEVKKGHFGVCEHKSCKKQGFCRIFRFQKELFKTHLAVVVGSKSSARLARYGGFKRKYTLSSNHRNS